MDKNVNTMLNSTIRRLNSGMTNESVIHNVVSEIVNNFNQSSIVTNENKRQMNHYYDEIRGGKPKRSLADNLPEMTGGCNVIQKALAYYLSNTNKYDEILYNKASSYGIPTDKIILLILLNNIYDIKSFCKDNNLTQEQTQTIITLKKSSALHNVEYNF
jgi:hypothetical protein